MKSKYPGIPAQLHPMRPIYMALALFAVTVIVTMVACKKVEEKGPTISVQPGLASMDFNAGASVTFTVRGIAGDNELRRFSISQQQLGGASFSLKDTVVFGQDRSFEFYYTVPSGAPLVTLKFTIVDAVGREASSERTINVLTSLYLVETTGYELFTPFNMSGNNAFNFDSLTFMNLSSNPNAESIHLTESDITDDGVMSRTVGSPSGIKFVRNNAFNYAQASQITASGNFPVASAQAYISNIQVDDILITEYDTVQHRFAVIKFTDVIDGAASGSDRYVFNVKK